MRKLLLLLTLFSVPALAQGTGPFTSKTFTQALTGSAPTLATDSVDLGGAAGFVVVVSANAGQTITGGSLLCYYLGAVSGQTLQGGPTQRWMRCPTSLDFTPATGVRDAPSGDYSTPASYGKIKFVPSAITVSGGTTVDVTITVRKVTAAPRPLPSWRLVRLGHTLAGRRAA